MTKYYVLRETTEVRYHYSMIFVNSRRPILEKRTSFLYKSAEDWYDGEGRYRLRILPEGD